MGTRLIAKDIDAEDTAVEYLAPVRRGLEALHFINKSALKSARNYAPGKPNSVLVGTPLAINDVHLRFKALSSYIQTQVREARSMTIFTVARSQDLLDSNATRPLFYGTYMSPPADGSAGNTYGIAVYSDSATTIASTVGRGTSVSNHELGGTALATTIANWSLFVHRIGVGAEERNIFRNETAGTQSQNPVVTAPRYPTGATLRIGSGYSQMAGHSDIAFSQIHNVELTADEIAATVADIRRHMSRRGLVV